MDPRLVPKLVCPWCGTGDLQLLGTGGASTGPPSGSATIGHADLRCPGCARSTAIRHGIWDAMGPHHAPRTVAQLSNVVPPTPQLYERVWRVRSLTLLSHRKFPNSEELAELHAAISPAADGCYLDVGCSEGLYARSLASTGAAVAALDHSVAFLRRAHIRADRAGVRLTLIRGVAQHLPFAAGAFDGACSGGSLNEIGDQAMALAETGRVLRPGGQFFSMHLLASQRRGGRLAQRIAAMSGITFADRLETDRRLQRAGLVIIDERIDGVVARVSAKKGLPDPTAA